MPQPPPTPPEELSAVALLLHTAVPPATDHAYRTQPSRASTAVHLAGGHGLDLGGEHAELFTQMFVDPDQLHRFAHEPTEQRAILVLVLDPWSTRSSTCSTSSPTICTRSCWRGPPWQAGYDPVAGSQPA